MWEKSRGKEDHEERMEMETKCETSKDEPGRKARMCDASEDCEVPGCAVQLAMQSGPQETDQELSSPPFLF